MEQKYIGLGCQQYTVLNSPRFRHPAYVVYSRDSIGAAREKSLGGLRTAVQN